MVFVSGGTGYMGGAVIPELLKAGESVRVLARAGSESKVSAGAQIVTGNALDAASFARAVNGCGTYLHMVGTPHPTPWKGEQFRRIDLVALRQSVLAAQSAGVEHFVYISVAHPAPMMREYVEVRKECERCLVDSGLTSTILRPWYVLGPGHWWPYALVPVYRLLEAIPATRDGAQRLGLVTLRQMRNAIVTTVLNRNRSLRVLGVPEIRRM